MAECRAGIWPSRALVRMSVPATQRRIKKIVQFNEHFFDYVTFFIRLSIYKMCSLVYKRV